MEMPAQFWLQARQVVYPDCPEANPLQEMQLHWPSDLPVASAWKQLRASSSMMPSSPTFWRTILFMERHIFFGRHSFTAVSHLHVWLYILLEKNPSPERAIITCLILGRRAEREQ